jgi:hypothetical protein
MGDRVWRTMTRQGDEEAGFAIACDGSELRIRAWGFWSVELAIQFEASIEREVAGFLRLNGLRLDVAELKPMRDEGQAAWTGAFAFLKARGVRKVQLSEPPPLTKLQFMRLCRNVGIAFNVG